MKAIKDHFFALKKAVSLLLKGHFLVFFIPGLSIALLFLLFFLLISATESIIGLIAYTPWVGSYIDTAVDSVFSWINGISIFIYQFTIITLLSPFHTVLSQRLETHLTGNKFKSNATQFFKDIIRTLGIVIVGGVLYLILFLLWSFIAWTFGLSILSPFISAILIAFFTGFNSYDYALERHKISINESWKFAFHHPIQMVLTGLIFTILLYIPILGVVIAPVILTMAGTINYLKLSSSRNNKTTQ